ncbi:uncharacterized protein LOC128241939 [Mya arenaria]|nr:uncharacterized protein LOC128241939 [Mya arenaria]
MSNCPQIAARDDPDITLSSYDTGPGAIVVVSCSGFGRHVDGPTRLVCNGGQWSDTPSTTCKSQLDDKESLYLGIGLGSAALVIVCIFWVCVAYFYCKHKWRRRYNSSFDSEYREDKIRQPMHDFFPTSHPWGPPPGYDSFPYRSRRGYRFHDNRRYGYYGNNGIDFHSNRGYHDNEGFKRGSYSDVSRISIRKHRHDWDNEDYFGDKKFRKGSFSDRSNDSFRRRYHGHRRHFDGENNYRRTRRFSDGDLGYHQRTRFSGGNRLLDDGRHSFDRNYSRHRRRYSDPLYYGPYGPPVDKYYVSEPRIPYRTRPTVKVYEYEVEAPPYREEKIIEYVHEPVRRTPPPTVTYVKPRPIEIVEERPIIIESSPRYEQIIIKDDRPRLDNARYVSDRRSGFESVILDDDPVHVKYDVRAGRRTYTDVLPAAKIVELDDREELMVPREVPIKSGHYEATTVDGSTSNYFFGRQDFHRSSRNGESALRRSAYNGNGDVRNGDSAFRRSTYTRNSDQNLRRSTYGGNDLRGTNLRGTQNELDHVLYHGKGKVTEIYEDPSEYALPKARIL